ncbi:AMP-binding protein [Arthrobacter psychrochitiniphilus]|uniref:AMP-binding protein n=1 Tax=Arthrobacter psychrochitiniphilus TaxID=291045 RepID=UPI003F7C6FB6
MTLGTLAQPVFPRDRLDHWAQRTPDLTAAVLGETSYTWAQWRTRILQLTDALAKAGSKRGDRTLSFDLNHLAIVELTFAASALGASTVVGNFRLGPSQLAHILEDSRPKMVFYGAELKSELAKAEAETPLPRMVAIGATVATGSNGATTGADYSGVGPQDTVLLMYNSGTTGKPKGMELTHASVNEHSVVAKAGFGMKPGEMTMVGMPMFHVGGSYYFQVGIYAGVEIVHLRETSAATMIGAMLQNEDHRNPPRSEVLQSAGKAPSWGGHSDCRSVQP